MSRLVQGFRGWAIDAAERCVKAFVTAFVGITLAGGLFGVDNADNMSLLTRGGVAGLGAATSVLLSLLAKWAGEPDNASFLD